MKLSKSLGDLYFLMISGGEPFIREDLPEILDIFIENNHPAAISIPTNGLLKEAILNQTQHVASSHKDVRFFISLPLDGFRETHDFLKGKEGMFDCSIETAQDLCRLRKKHPNISVNIVTTVSNANLREILPLFKFVKENLEVNKHNCHPVRGNVMDKNMRPPSGSEWMKLWRQLTPYKRFYLKKKQSRTYRFLFSWGSRKTAMITAQSLDGKKWPFPCHAGQSVGVLEPDGGVRLCELTEIIGNARDTDYDFKKVWFSRRAEELRKKIGTKECTRGCTHGCFLNTSFMSNPLNLI